MQQHEHIATGTSGTRGTRGTQSRRRQYEGNGYGEGSTKELGYDEGGGVAGDGFETVHSAATDLSFARWVEAMDCRQQELDRQWQELRRMSAPSRPCHPR